MFEERPHRKFLPTVGIQTAHEERSSQRHKWCPNLQSTQCWRYRRFASTHATWILGIFNQRYSLGSIRKGVAFERRVMTHRHFHASRHRRETDARHMHPRRGHTLKHFSTLGIQTAHLKADNVHQRYCATGTLINICVIRQVLSCTSRLLSVL